MRWREVEKGRKGEGAKRRRGEKEKVLLPLKRLQTLQVAY